MINELGLNNVNNVTSTHTKATKQVDKIFSENISFLKNELNLEVPEISKNLSNINWTPEFHKKPYQNKVSNRGTQIPNETTFESCYSSIEVNIQPNLKILNLNIILALKHFSHFRTIKLSSTNLVINKTTKINLRNKAI